MLGNLWSSLAFRMTLPVTQQLSFLPSELQSLFSLTSCVTFVKRLDSFKHEHPLFPDEEMYDFKLISRANIP